MGAIGVRVKSIGDLEDAVRAAKAADRTTVIHIDVHPHGLDRREPFLVGVRNAPGRARGRA